MGRERFKPGWVGVGVGLAGALFVAALNLTPIYTNDFWVQLKVGDIIRETGSIPRTLQFAFTEAAEFPFYAHEWFPSVVTSSLYAVGGYEGVIAFKCAIALAIFALLFILSFQVNRDPVVSTFAGSLALLGMNFRTHMRPELFGFLFAAVVLNLLQRFMETHRLRWLVAMLPVQILWANCHGSFVVGIALPAVFAAGAVVDARKNLKPVVVPLALQTAAMALAGLATPMGAGLYRFAWSITQADFIRENIVEFTSTFDPINRRELYFDIYLFVAVVTVAVLAFGYRKLNARSVLLIAAFGYLSLDGIRYTAWFALVAAYPLAYALEGIAGATRARKRLAAGLTVVLVAAIAVVAVHGNVRARKIGFEFAAPLSREAISHLEQTGLRGNVFHSYNLGDQLVYHFYPQARVTIDSRSFDYGAEYLEWYRTLDGRSLRRLAPPDTLLAFLDRYRVDTIVSTPGDFRRWIRAGHALALDRAGWAVGYNDATAVVLRRLRPAGVQ